MIRDHPVIGLLDANLVERLQLEADLKLVEAIPLARNSETVKSQQPTLSGSVTSWMHEAVAVYAIKHALSAPKKQATTTLNQGR